MNINNNIDLYHIIIKMNIKKKIDLFYIIIKMNIIIFHIIFKNILIKIILLTYSFYL